MESATTFDILLYVQLKELDTGDCYFKHDVATNPMAGRNIILLGL